MVLSLNDYVYCSPDSLYHIKMDKLDFRASTGRLKIRKFAVVPKYAEMDFAKIAGYPKARFNVSCNDISLGGIDFPLYLSKQELFAREMQIENGFVAIFTTNEFSDKALPKHGRFPHQLLQTLNRWVTVQKLKLHNIDLSYSAYNKESKQRGTITFDNTAGTISNLTNVPKYKGLNPVMSAKLSSRFMNKGDLKVDFRFHLSAANGFFKYSGNLRQMDGRALNKITKPLAMLQIKSGYIDELKFEVRADENHALGKLDFRYHNLGVRLLQRSEDSERLVAKGWLSFLANNLIINSENPSRDGKLVTAGINYRRPETASFFSFLYKSLFQGIKHSIGFTPEKEKAIRSQIEKFEKMKSDRDKRRENRLKRR